jgi:hypothetical protein
MNHFEGLVEEQLKTMDKLLFVQSEIERCQQLEAELLALQEETNIQSIKDEIAKMKIELRQIHETFDKQTEELVQLYQQSIQPIA